MKVYKRIKQLLDDIDNSKSATEIEAKKDEINRLLLSNRMVVASSTDIDINLIRNVYTRINMLFRPLY